MPSPVGHAIAGLVTAWTADLLPDGRAGRARATVSSWYQRVGGPVTLACAVLAALADIDLLFPGQHRTVTHSVTAVAVTFIIARVVTGQVTPRHAMRITLTCTAAYATHLLLDWMAVDPVFPYGIQMLWPFSDRWFISGWDLFPGTERRHIFSAASIATNVHAALVETAILGPVALIVYLVRVKALARLAPEVTGRDHPPQ